jgi:phage tail sheath protein FI
MAASYKSPGVFVEEVSKLPPSVAQVETAIPAFIGYTAKAEQNGESLFGKATAIESMTEFELIFGGAPSGKFTAYLDTDDRVAAVRSSQPYVLHESMRLFFDNGGGRCYIIAVGAYKAASPFANLDELKTGLVELEKHDEPTIIVSPDATLLASDGLYDFQKQALAQCAKLGDRVMLCDTYPSNETVNAEKFTARVQDFRDKIGINALKYGAAYAPYLRSSLPKTVRFRDLELRRGDPPPAVSAPAPLESLTMDKTVLQLILDLKGAKKAVDDIDGIEKTTAPGILSLSTSLEGEFKSLLDAYTAAAPPAAAQLAAVYDFVLTFFGALKTIKDALPTKAPDASEFPSSTKSLAFLLRDEILSVAKTAGLVDAFKVLGTHAQAYPGGSGDTELLDDATERAKALDILGLAAGDYTGLDNADISALYDGKGANERSAEARKAVSAFYPVLAKFLSALKLAARTFESTFDSSLEAALGAYKRIKGGVAASASVLPPSGVIAGVYALVDSQRGVWKAPANVSLNSVSAPVLPISAEQQEGLNVDAISGKSINAIRTFTGKGILVWGARTLAGNDNEWRYVSVRRFFNMVEESCKKATEPFVFEPNDANTWVRVQGMLENFLTLQWRAGALQGAKPDDAFYVAVGLGKTMTAIDILEGRMICEIGMAVVRPAEFIILRFSHLMAKS